MLKGEGPYAIVQYVRLSYNLVPTYLSSGFSSDVFPLTEAVPVLPI